MTEYGEEIIDRLPANSNLRDLDNPMNKVLQNTVGEWLDNYEDMDLYEQLFLNSANSGYLDLFGRQYGVYRRVEEPDEEYRQRIIYEIIGHLTVNYLGRIYNVSLFVGDSFDAGKNTLLSDNPYIDGNFLGFADENVQVALNNKFILNDAILWIENGLSDLILNLNNENILNQFKGIYTMKNGGRYFRGNEDIKEVRLTVPNLISAVNMFGFCSSLTSVSLNLPNLTNGEYMFNECSSLTSVSLNLPNLTNGNIFYECSSLTSVSLNLPNLTDGSKMFDFCSSLTNIDLNLPNLTNGEYMFNECSSLTSVSLNLPNLTDGEYMFNECSSLEYINLTIPTNLVGEMKTYILSLNLQYLETLIINGVEYIG